jgi:Fe2+ transport system protein B
MEQPKTLEAMVEEALTLSRENNKILKAMRRDALIGGILKTLIWVVLLVASLYFSMKFLEPYMGMLKNLPQEGNQTDYGALFEEYKSLLGQ